ncbi:MULTISPECIES: DUF4272 domain-containing protein [Xanthomonas]|uniref:DUF4272 domain-containing protein n=1 Tax=Xanthomonas TaxID=338 RepID=UPI002405E08B|nr:DUF4272 domain-containing protein [Xanthomonas euvesicatoria]MCP3037160.1 DUF4272 domain-containing protein [Xanthomonas euvesicatoria pv. allii]
MALLVNAYSTLRTPLWPDFLPQAAVQRRDHADPELAAHLHGFVGYVNQAGDGQMTQARYHLMRHVQRVRQHFSFEVDDADLGALAQWAEHANAVCFLADGSVRDPQGRVLISQGEPAIDDDAQVPYPPDALQRRAQQLSVLAAQGIRVPPSLPPVPGEAEARVRDAAVVSRRMLALFAVALRAEILAAGDTPPSLDEVETRLPGVADALSPQERAFFAQPAPDAQALANFGWRYESLAVLQWALGLADTLPEPNALCDVPLIAQRALDNAQAAERPTPARRPLAELLDTLDRHLRLHWAVRQAGQSGQPVPAGIVPGVVYERHYALNWLLHFEDAEWDEVDTPT